jgi:hypothetical protein
VPRSLTRFEQHGVDYRSVRDLAVDMALSAAWKSGERSPVRDRFVIALRAVAGARSQATAARAR